MFYGAEHRPYSIYGTWGLHDELGDRVELSESLAAGALEQLIRWRDAFGVRTDYFLLDAFWFDPERGYRHFKKPHWPRGFEPLRDRILAAGIKPGLWFSTTGLKLEVPAWRESRAESGHYSLVDGPYADDLEASLLHAAEQWSVRFFKFDFVDFAASAPGSRRSRETTYALAVGRFKQALRRLRERFPDVRIITHCGFARNPTCPPPGTPDWIGADPSLLEVADAVFSGDPHPFDLPQTAMTRHLDLYQDRQVWRLHREGFPLHRIEDHGALIATTNTAAYRGRSGFRRTHIGQLARGGQRDMFYGDPALLTDDDVRGLQRARAVYFDAFAAGLATSYVGEGEPGLAPWHGYLTGGGDAGLLYLVNPHWERRRVQLDLPCLLDARTLFHDGPEPPSLYTQRDHLALELGPEQMAVVGLGRYADERASFGPDTDPPTPAEIRLLNAAFRATPEGLEANVAPLPISGAELLVVAEAQDVGPEFVGPARPYRFGQQTGQSGAPGESAAHELLRIRVIAGNREIVPSSRIPDGPVWAGISWVAARFAVSGPCRVRVTPAFDKPRRIRVSAYAVR